MVYQILFIFGIFSQNQSFAGPAACFSNLGLNINADLVQAVGKSIGTCSTNNGKISLFEETPVDNINATNEGVKSVFDLKSGGVKFSVDMTKFVFPKPLMQEHFNSPDFLDTKKFPSAVFEGGIQDFSKVDPKKSGPQSVTVSGKMNMHGKIQDVVAKGTIEFKPDGTVEGKTKFTIKPSDYGVVIGGIKKLVVSADDPVELNVEMNYKGN